jgi:hypothetical protein
MAMIMGCGRREERTPKSAPESNETDTRQQRRFVPGAEDRDREVLHPRGDGIDHPVGDALDQ